MPASYTRFPVPLDSVSTYITGEDVWGEPVPAALTVGALRQLPLSVTLDFCAQLLALVDDERLTQKQVDRALQAEFRPEVWRRISALLAGGNRVLVAPQVLLQLIKYAAVFSGDDLVPDVRPGHPLMAMFGVADDLQRRDDLGDDGGLVVGTGVPGRLEREIVATHHFHRQIDSQHVLAMFVRRWLQLPTELAGQRDVVDLASEFRGAVEVDLRDFVAVGMALYAYVLSHGPRVPRDHLRHLNIDCAVTERILGLVTTTVTDLRGWVHGERTAESCWEFSHLQRFPLLDRGDHLLVLRPGLLLQRFFGWLPSFDLEAGLGTGKAAERHKQRIRTCVGRVSEAYARETFEVQARRHGWRLFSESQLQAALCRPGTGKSCDLTLDDGRRWALFEVTSSRLTRQSVASTSAEQLHKDIDKLVTKMAQIDMTIKNLRVREAALTGSPAAAGPRRYYPVLILTEGFPVNPVTLTMLRQRAENAQLLMGDDTSALEVVDVTELEMLEGADLGEMTLLDALAAKSSAALARCNLRDFLMRERDLRGGSPPRVRRHAQVMFDIAIRAATPPSSSGAA